MDLWEALGVSRNTGLIAVGAGAVFVLFVAAGIAARRRREDRSARLGLSDR